MSEPKQLPCVQFDKRRLLVLFSKRCLTRIIKVYSITVEYLGVLQSDAHRHSEDELCTEDAVSHQPTCLLAPVTSVWIAVSDWMVGFQMKGP